MKFALFTDFHFGHSNVTQEAALGELVNYCLSQVDGINHAIVVAGDVANSGKAPEYDRFVASFLEPLRRDPRFADSRVLCVPGNHDIDCDSVLPVTWDSLGKSRRAAYFTESDKGIAVRAPRAQGFSNFESFVRNNGIAAPMPTECVSCNEIVTVDGLDFRFVLTNTAHFADREDDGEADGQYPAPTESLRIVFGTEEPKSSLERTIVVGHHPIASFAFDQREPFKSFLVKRKAVYLHGHVHELTAEHGPPTHGLLELGFGAAYPGKLDAPATRYKNGFALCDWTESGLTVRPFHWDADVGQWTPTNSVPTAFPAPVAGTGATYVFPTIGSKIRSTHAVSPGVRPRNAPRCTGISLLGDAGPREFLRACKRVDVLHGIPAEADMRIVSENPGQITFQYESSRLRVSTAAGELLTRDEVERTNTLIDYEGLTSFTIVTTGTMASDARASYLRLKTRKPLHILENEELSAKTLDGVGDALRHRLGVLDAATASIEFLVDVGGFHLLVHDLEGVRWFYVLSEDGTTAAETSDVVLALRATRPRFVGMTYLIQATPVSGATQDQALRFDRAEYLKRCFAEFNTVRYAALASFGFRFSSITLDELYVSASAVEGNVSEAAIARAVDDALQGLQLPDELRAQLEAEVRRSVMYGRPRESTEASRLYQRHGCVLFLGDPGSGKTCFVKHEILSYCRTSDRDGWYDVHLPVYVPLSELAPLLSIEPTTQELLGHVSALCAKRGLSVPRDRLIELSAAGKVAFFFDGLDEVTSLDDRSRVFACIVKLVDSAQASGNRIVVTSRPAATRLLEVPSHLHSLSLRGLSEREMRTLAHRVLAARLAEGGVDVQLEQTELTPADEALVETLVRDCRDTPGLRRLAQNPLLFTLLIMIYANSGPPAAKRHRIYHQAIQTLASVRSREAGHRAFSEADLRRRLGRMAFAVVRDGTATVPRWNDSVQELRRVIAAERGVPEDAVEVAEVEDFLQRVGESTGLILPHRQPAAPDGGSITFMHHSFLEYYAAAGLLAEPAAVAKVIDFARIPRWREVVLLCAGMLAEQGDPTELISGLLKSVSDEEPLTMSNVEFAIECALEGDVPAETLHDEILRALAQGEDTMRRDPELRSRMGSWLAKLFAAGRSERITSFLAEGLKGTEAGSVALYLNLTAVTLIDEKLVPRELAAPLVTAFQTNDTQLLIARAEALAVAHCLRTDERVEALKKAFKGAEPAQYAAVKACERSPEIARVHWDQLREKLKEQAYFAVPAAAAILRAGWKIDPSNEVNRAEVTQALRCLMQFASGSNIEGVGSAVEFSTVDALLTSTDAERRALGICLLPWVRHAEQAVRDRLLDCILKPSFTHSEKALALGALRLSEGAQQLIKISDLDQIYPLLRAQTRDVRIATAKLIGALDPEPTALQKLLEYTKNAESAGQEEFRAALRSLGELRVARDGDPAETRAYVEGELFRRLAPGQRQGTETRRNLLEFLQLSFQHDRVAPQKLIGRMTACVGEASWSNDVRGTVLAALGWLWRPSEESVNFLIVQATRPGGEMHAAKIEAVWRFTQRCKRRFDYVREVYGRLDPLRDATILLARSTPRTWQGQNDFSRVRQALEEIGAMKHAYNEYSARAPLMPGSGRPGPRKQPKKS